MASITISKKSPVSGNLSKDTSDTQSTRLNHEPLLKTAKSLNPTMNGYPKSNETANDFHYNRDTVHTQSLREETLADISGNGQTPIAICGMAIRLPAGLNNLQQLWDFLLAKGDARSKVPKSRYNVSAFYDPTGKPGTVKTEYGYFLDEDISLLDTSFFSMARMEVERLDPQQRLMLEVARECLEDAGETNWRGKKIGCYIGSLGEDWCEMFARETQNHGNYRITGHGDFALSNRVSYEMDLKGPRFVRIDDRHFGSNEFQCDYSNGVLSLACCSS